MQSAYVYMMSNARHTVLYIGVTHDLMRRVAEHKAKIHTGFTEKYNVWIDWCILKQQTLWLMRLREKNS